MSVPGYQLIANSLHQLGVEAFFYVMGGPLLHTERACLDIGIRGIDHRHEQGAGMAAHAYARISGRPAVVMGCSGPGILNTMTAVATANADRAPMVVIGGSVGLASVDRGGFQDGDQLASFRPITKWAVRIPTTDRIPEYLEAAWRLCQEGTPGPVYLDISATTIYDEADAVAIEEPRLTEAPIAPAASVERAMKTLASAERPVVVAGSGVSWGQASDSLRAFVEAFRIPVFTTPMARGVIDEDHELVLSGARSLAFREADCVLFVGTRLNYVVSHGESPRFAPDAAVIRLDISPDALSRGRGGLLMHGDIGKSLDALRSVSARDGLSPRDTGPWLRRLEARHEQKKTEFSALAAPPESGAAIHPVALCRQLVTHLHGPSR